MIDAAREGRDRSRRSWLHSPYLWATIASLIAIPAMRPFLRHEPAPPPVLFRLPPFTLVDSNGLPFGSAQLEGRVYVLGFFSTRAEAAAPGPVEALARLDRRFREAGRDGVPLVSITVEPEADTPPVLRAFGDANGIDARRWSLLTGPADEIRALLAGSAGRLVLVDREGGVRGSYGTDEAGIDEVFHRSRHVEEEPSRTPPRL